MVPLNKIQRIIINQYTGVNSLGVTPHLHAQMGQLIIYSFWTDGTATYIYIQSSKEHDVLLLWPEQGQYLLKVPQ